MENLVCLLIGSFKKKGEDEIVLSLRSVRDYSPVTVVVTVAKNPR